MANTSSITIANISTNPDSECPIIFDNAYKGDEITKRCAEILGFSNIHGWKVVDHDDEDNLALVHYDADADMDVYGHLRGVFIDLEVGAIIADSFGYTPTAVGVLSDFIKEDGSLFIKDKEGGSHTFLPGESVIKRVFEGVVIRVIWRKNKMYKITHRKINPARSRWGASKYFLSMYEEAGGPTAEQLFDTSKPYSNTCYDFLVVDQSLLVGTRQKVTAPYIVYLTQRTMDIKRPIEDVAPGHATFNTTDTIGSIITSPMIHNPKPLTIAEANQHLQFGYYNAFAVDDIRQRTGEAVIIYKMVDGVVNDIVKVHSSAYEWRANLRGNNPNITNQFYALLNTVYPEVKTAEAWNTLKSKLIILPKWDEDSVKTLFLQNQCIFNISSGEVYQDDFSQRDSRIYLLWLNYVLSLPAHLQADGLNILAHFLNDRRDLITWIQSLESNNRDLEKLEVSARIKGIITASRTLAKRRIDQGDNYSSKGSYMKLPVVIKSTISNLINKENGPSLYCLVREMKLARSQTPPVTSDVITTD